MNDYWHATRVHTGRTCWSSPFRLRHRICLRCIGRVLTGKRRASRKAWEARTQRFRDCPHTNTRPNPKATAVLDQNPRVCLDCGIGIVDARRRDG